MAKTIANPTPSQVSGRLATWHRVMEEAGLTYDALQLPIDNPQMRKCLVYFWMSGGFEATTSQKRAREIMGVNIFGVEENIKHFAINPTRQQLAVLSEVPFTEEVLQARKDTHVLIATFQLSILDIRNKAPRNLFYSHDDAWYNKQSFAKDKGEVGWHLVRKTLVQNSTSKTWSEQQALLGKDDETPTARVMVYTIIGHFMATGERLFEHIYVRTSSVDSDDDRVYVGDLGSDGLHVGSRWGDYRGGYLGVASSRKSN